ncbi:hypothetical protein BDP81DRAFT_420868 [Colletotrichum phormii]|uniref:Uncharacterized protein n=1 Tax=Colletotrichum phormii TaxID=359342 RepID=A0AAI9ZWX0_9PEZI|nr:uncharacterized protein BDP81DRAFT_420868 [Colletotrichum phormii]KAK1639381.1 hypothetical protein BDP81DRAFT_420868 [Colletotrichum phormii]
MKSPITSLLLLLLASTAALVSAIKPGGKGPMNMPRERAHMWQQVACKMGHGNLFITPYKLTAIVDEEVSNICHRLWHNLKRTDIACALPSRTVCEDHGDKSIQEKRLYWSFDVFTSCPAAAVDSAWYESTGNIWGRSRCGEGKYEYADLPELPFPYEKERPTFGEA